MTIEDFLIQLEGERLKPYKDVAGHWTIGVGHLITKEEKKAKRLFSGDVAILYENGITKEQARELLKHDLEKVDKVIEQTIQVPLDREQRIALTSFCFNVGITAFRNSTLLRYLNEGEYKLVPVEMIRWLYSGGKRREELINRRLNEILMWVGYFTE